MGRKRGRDDGGDGGGGGGGAGQEAEAPPSTRPRRPELSVGERTSHIKNKQRRGEVYDRLRHKAAVRGSARSERAHARK